MSGILRSELYRISKRAQSKTLLAIMAVIILLFYGGFTIAHFVNPDDQDYIDFVSVDNIVDNGLSFVFLFGTILLTVFSSSLIGSEFGWNTLRPLLARTPTRSALLGAKWATVAIYVAVFVLFSVLFTIVTATVASMIVGEGFGLSMSHITDNLGAAARLFIAFLPIAALAMMFALVTKSNAAGIALGVVYAFIEPIVFALLGALSDVFDSIQKAMPYYSAGEVFSYGTEDGSTRSEMLTGIGVIGIWVALFVLITLFVFNRRDVTSG